MTDDDDTFRIVLLAGLSILLPIAGYYRLRSLRTGERLDRRQEGLFILLTLRPLGFAMMAGLIAFVVSPKTMAWSSVALPVWMRWMGAAMGVAAALLLAWTLRTLGDNLTDTVVTRKAHTLVTTGPYRWVRHPFYVALALAVAANGLAAANWFVLLSGSLVFALLVVRCAKEEENLIARFGDEYRDYMQRTGRFVPRAVRSK
ncbi:MAG: isoprenylcysteine carboxylmethyltransferase family protein [Hyphomicrobiaceae bacterium]